MQLVEADGVDLDAAVHGCLDGFTSDPAGTITVRQLLDHTSGYSTWQGNTAPTDLWSRS